MTTDGFNPQGTPGNAAGGAAPLVQGGSHDWAGISSGSATSGGGSAAGSKCRVLLLDDQPIFRHGTASVLTAARDFQVLAELADAKSAFQVMAAGPVDLLITESTVPDATLAKFLGRVRQEHRQVKIIVFTSQASRSAFQQAFHLGASGFLLKRATPLELVTAARAVSSGGIYIDPYIARTIVAPGINRTAVLDDLGKAGAASARELEVLRLFVLGHTNKEIAAQLSISVKTVENHKSRGMKKLGLRTRAEVVRHVMLEWQGEPKIAE
jgi:DNA-binding NarL/FixJ family response regulator